MHGPYQYSNHLLFCGIMIANFYLMQKIEDKRRSPRKSADGNFAYSFASH